MRKNDPPYYLEARNKEDLYLLMLSNNAKYKKKFHYFDFNFAQGKWSCWFEVSVIEKVEQSHGG